MNALTEFFVRIFEAVSPFMIVFGPILISVGVLLLVLSIRNFEEHFERDFEKHLHRYWDREIDKIEKRRDRAARKEVKRMAKRASAGMITEDGDRSPS